MLIRIAPPRLVTRRGLLTGAAATAAYAGLGHNSAVAAPIAVVAHTFVQSVSGTNAGPSPAIDTTGATAIIIGSTINLIGGTALPNDSKTNTWTDLGTVANGGATQSQIALAWGSGLVVGTGHTFGMNTTNPGLVIIALSGVLVTSNPLDQARTQAITAAGTTLQPGSQTPTVDNCVFFVYTGDAWTGITAINSGTITDQSPLSPAGHVAFATFGAYLVQTAKTAFNPTVTFTGAARAEVMMVALRPALPPAGHSRVTQ